MMEAGIPWQLVLEKVEQRCGYLLGSGQWSDCTFVVGSGTNQTVLPAHKLILAMASPVFEAMFYGGLSEPNEQIVSIPDIQPEAFRTLLQYIYTGNITIGSFDMAWDLWYGAKKYMLPHLIKECSSYICSVLGPGNVCRAYEYALLFDEESLIDKCIQIISRNTKEVLSDISFEDVQLNTLITMFSLDHLNVDSELDLVDALSRYTKAEQMRQKKICPLEDNEPPSEKLSELRLEHQPSEEKVLLPSVESTSQTSPTAELHPNTPDVLISKVTADKEHFKDKPTIRAAIEKIRFLSLSPQQFAEGPARSGLLTEAETFAVLMNIASTASAVPMPTGFSERREQRQLLSDVQEFSCKGADLSMAPRKQSRKQSRDKQLVQGRAPPLAYADEKEEEMLTPAELVQGLNSSDLARMTMAARAVRRMLSMTPNPAISVMIDAGVIAPLVAALDRDDCSDLQFEAAWALTNIASGTREHTLAVVDGGAIPKLIALLGHGGVVAEQAAWALGNIAGDGPVTRDAVLNLGALPALLPYMHPNTPSTQLRINVWTYSNLCRYRNPLVTFELVSPALSLISNLLVLTDQKVLADACWALSYLTDGPNERIEAVQATPGLTEQLTALLGHPAPQVQTAALRALGNMLTGTDVQTDRCLEAGCLDHIINLLKCGKASRVKEAAWAASNILAGTQPQIQRALDKQILEPLINILAKGDIKCKKEATWAINKLCLGGTAEQLYVLVSAGFLEPYCLLLSSPNHRVVLLILDGLSNLLQASLKYFQVDTICLKLQDIGVLEQIEALKQHENEQVNEKAVKLFETYFRYFRKGI